MTKFEIFIVRIKAFIVAINGDFQALKTLYFKSLTGAKTIGLDADYVITHAQSYAVGLEGGFVGSQAAWEALHGKTDNQIYQQAANEISAAGGGWLIIKDSLENYSGVIPKDDVMTIGAVEGKTTMKAMRTFAQGMGGLIYVGNFDSGGNPIIVKNCSFQDTIFDANNKQTTTGVSIYRFDGLKFKGCEVRNVKGVHGWKLGDYGSPPKQMIPKITITSPAVVTTKDMYTESTNVAHGLVNGDTVHFRTEGTLPTGITVDQKYYVVNATTYTYELSLTNGGASINTSGTQNGRHRFYKNTPLTKMPENVISYGLQMNDCDTNNVYDTTNEGCLTSNTDDITINGSRFKNCDLINASIVSMYLGSKNVKFTGNTVKSATDDFGLVDITGADNVTCSGNTMNQEGANGNNGFIIRNSTNVSITGGNTLKGNNSTGFGGNGVYMLDWAVHIDGFIGTAVKSENINITSNNINGFYYSIIELDDDQNFSKRNDRNNVVIVGNTCLNFGYSFFKILNMTSHVSGHIITGNVAKGKAVDTKVIWILGRNNNARLRNSIIKNNVIQSGGFNSWSIILDWIDNVEYRPNNCTPSGTGVALTVTNEINEIPDPADEALAYAAAI